MKKSISGANGALLLLLGINLFNYIDRQILAALEPDIRASFFATGDVNAMTKTGLLGDAFFVTYMISAPILGLLIYRAKSLLQPVSFTWMAAMPRRLCRRHFGRAKQLSPLSSILTNCMTTRRRNCCATSIISSRQKSS